MLIGELSKKTGISKDTIRFYEKMGLITSTDRQAGSRIYKEYSTEAIERLLMINQGKKLGFTLGEIKQLMQDWEEGMMSKQDKIRIIKSKLEEINQKMEQLATIKTYLLDKLSKLD